MSKPKICPKCNTEFTDPTAYYLHLLEENLKVQMQMAVDLAKVNENFDLFFTYTTEEDTTQKEINEEVVEEEEGLPALLTPGAKTESEEQEEPTEEKEKKPEITSTQQEELYKTLEDL